MKNVVWLYNGSGFPKIGKLTEKSAGDWEQVLCDDGVTLAMVRKGEIYHCPEDLERLTAAIKQEADMSARALHYITHWEHCPAQEEGSDNG